MLRVRKSLVFTVVLPGTNRPWLRLTMNDKSSSDSEFRLIQAVLAGNSQAFGDLVTKYQDRLFNSLIHVLGNEYDAQDITQDAFI